MLFFAAIASTLSLEGKSTKCLTTSILLYGTVMHIWLVNLAHIGGGKLSPCRVFKCF